MSRSGSFVAVSAALCVALAAACSKAESRATQGGLPAAGTGETVAVPGGSPPAGAPAGETVAVPGGTAAPAAAPGAPAPAASDKPDPSFKLTVAAPAPGAVGAEAVAKITVVPGPGYKMNKEYPTKLSVQAPEGLTVAKADQVLSDGTFDPHQIAFDVKLSAAKPGTYAVAGTIKFAVCTDQTCDPKKQTIAFDVVTR